MKKTILILIIAIILLFLFLFLDKRYIEANSVLTCTRSNNDKIVIKFNADGIEKVVINNEELKGIELAGYMANFVSAFAWNNMMADKYTELELIEEHIKDVKSFEENHEEYSSICDH